MALSSRMPRPAATWKTVAASVIPARRDHLMNLLIAYLSIGVGSALGGVARYGAGVLATALWGSSFPWGTIIVNVIGSFVIGFFATLTSPDGRLVVGTLGRQFVMVGLCGGFTTFSAFGLETVDLVHSGRIGA